MSDIENWLHNLGLAKYATAFVENDIDLDIVSQLSEDELQSLGVSLGDRKRLLNAIATVAEGHLCPPADDTMVESQEAERRQLTVLFCDLVGSTSLSESMDPEDYRDLLASYQDAASAALETQGGVIARFMGDGILAYFGYPAAHENDPERAVRAGLSVVHAIAELGAVVPLAVRVGIATGPVVVGDIVGEGVAQEAAVLGETPNLAARLQAAAEPGTVLLGPLTVRHLAGRIETQAVTPLSLKGLSQPVAAHRAVRARNAAEIGEGSADATQIVGREVELAMLERAWRTACAGEGQAVMLVGEAGVGKSRLLRAFLERDGGDATSVVRWHCSAFEQTTAHHAAIGHLRWQLGLAHADRAGDDSGSALDRLEAFLERLALDVPRLAPLLARMLSVHTEGRYPKLDLAPATLRHRLLEAQLELLVAAAHLGPVLFVVEDLHWADPTTLEVLEAALDTIAREPVLLLFSTRPEFETPWQAYPQLTHHRLEHLNRLETAALVQRIAAGYDMSDERLAEIVDRTDGVPLFIEELTRNYLEATGAARVPESLQDSLMARIDRLGSAKAVAQAAAVIGRTFTLTDLVDITGQESAALESALGQIVASGLVYRRGSGQAEAFEFKHALVQDTAYGSLLNRRKREYHRTFVRALERRHDHDPRPVLELLAHHCAAARLDLDAVRYARLAAEKAAGQSAYHEALEFLERALVTLASLPESDDALHEAIEVRLRMRVCLGALGQYERLLTLLEEAEVLAVKAGDIEREIGAALHKVHTLYHLGELEAAVAAGHAARDRAEGTDNEVLSLGANAMLAQASFFHGRLRESADAYARDIDKLRSQYRHAQLQTTATSSVNWLANLAGTHALLGEFERADGLIADARAIAAETAKPFDIGMATQWSGCVLQTAGRFEELVRELEPVMTLMESERLDFLWPWLARSLGYAYAYVDRAAEGAELLQRATQRADELGLRTCAIWIAAWRPDVDRRAGRLDEAVQHAETAVKSARRGGLEWMECHATRALAAARAALGDTSTPPELWGRAIELARACGARPYLARCYQELGRHLLAVGKEGQGNTCLDGAQAIYRDMGLRLD